MCDLLLGRVFRLGGCSDGEDGERIVGEEDIGFVGLCGVCGV